MNAFIGDVGLAPEGVFTQLYSLREKLREGNYVSPVLKNIMETR